MKHAEWMADPALCAAAEAIRNSGWSDSDCARQVALVEDAPISQQPLVEFQRRMEDSGIVLETQTFERVLLLHAAAIAAPRIETLPVHPQVKALLAEDFAGFARLRPNDPPVLGTYQFSTACKLATLRRFPAGPLDWESSSLPRSWVLKAGPAGPRLLWFTLTRLGGFGPVFFMHAARRPRNRGLVIETEVMRAYFRMAQSLAQQREFKGFVAAAWFHDPAAVRDNPHLAALNAPYLQHGGYITRIGSANLDSGFAEHNLERRRKFEAGELSYGIHVAIWPRRAALEWAGRHPELGR